MKGPAAKYAAACEPLGPGAQQQQQQGEQKAEEAGRAESAVSAPAGVKIG